MSSVSTVQQSLVPVVPHVLFVLGVHRSGTSALAGALARSGAECGRALLPANEGNPSGYFELAPVVDLNNRLLTVLHHAWHDAAPLPPDWETEPAIRELEGAADALLREEFGGSAIAVLKDPRLCLTMPFWRRAIVRLGWSRSLVVIARPMTQVVRSLQLRELLSAADIAYLWARSMLEAARASLIDPSLLLTYDRLLGDPVGTLRHIACKFQITLNAEASSQFVDPGMRHHESVQPADVPAPLARFCADLYDLLDRAVRRGAALDAQQLAKTEAALEALDRTLLPQMLQRTCFELRSARAALLSENDVARCSAARLAAEIDSARQANERLAEEITSARAAHEDLSRQLDAARRANAALVEEVDTARRGNADLAAQVDAARSVNAGLAAEIDTARAANTDLAAQVDAARSVNAGLAAEIDTARAANTDLAAQVDAARSNIERLIAELDAARVANDDLIGQVSAARSHDAQRSAEIDAARQVIDELVAQIDVAKQSNASLTAEVDAARRTIDGLAGDVAAARDAHRARDLVEATLRSRVTEFEAWLRNSLAGRWLTAIGQGPKVH